MSSSEKEPSCEAGASFWAEELSSNELELFDPLEGQITRVHSMRALQPKMKHQPHKKALSQKKTYHSKFWTLNIFHMRG